MGFYAPDMKIFNKKTEEEKVEEEIISMVNEGNEQGLIHDDEMEMITNIFSFSEKETRDAMTARSNVIGIEINMTLDDAMRFMLENNYSRYPVYEEDIDSIVGILYFKDFVKAYLRDKTLKISDIMVEPVFVHPTFNISKLFKKMQTGKIHMVIVVDEYGQTEGVITMEDILEEIVGDIFDEYDEDNEDIEKKGDTYIVNGKADLDEIKEILDVEFPDEDIQTLNGFLLYELGRLPYPDEEVEIVYQGYLFKVCEIKNKMIDQVKITKVEK
ncbi:MAG: hemolysin family protein [Coprococcus sp.]